MAAGASIVHRIGLQGSADVLRQLNEIGAAGERSGARMAAGVDRATPRLGELNEAARHVSEGVERLRGAFGHLSEALPHAEGGFAQLRDAAGEFGGVLAKLSAVTVGLAGGLAGLADSAAKHAAEIFHASQRAGTSVENYQKLNFALRQTGAEGDAFERAVRMIAQAARHAGDELDKSQKQVGDGSQAAARRVAEAQETYSVSMARMRLRTDEFNQSVEESRKRGVSAAEAQRQVAAAQKLSASNALDAREANDRLNSSLAAAAEEQQHVSERLGNVTREAAGAAAAWNKIGVSLIDGAGKMRDPVAVFEDAADKIAQMRTQAERTQAAIELFGSRFGAQLVEALSKGKAGIQALGDEAVKLGVVLSGADVEAGVKFEESIRKLEDTAKATKDRLGLAVAPLFASVYGALAEALAKIQGPLAAGMQGLATMIKPIFDDIANALKGDADKVQNQFIMVMVEGFRALGLAIKVFWTIATDVISTIMGLFNGFAKVYDEAFGARLTGADIVAFVVALRGLVTVLAVLRSAFLLLTAAASPWTLAVLAISVAVLELIKHFETLKKIALEVGRAVAGALGMGGGAPAAAGASAADSGPPEGHAEGGEIHGPGSGTSDSILARLSDGEFVVNAMATKAFLPLLHAINGFRSPLASMAGAMAAPIAGGLPRFATGGLAVAGGDAGGRNIINLAIGNDRVDGLIANDAVANKLVSVARGRRIRSAGKRPSWDA